MAELNVTKKNIHSLFVEMQNKKFIIPDYQRPYKWDREKCETLWQDLTSFFEEQKDQQEYYLGTIVTCRNEDTEDSKDAEIIDGQQRITSMLLLLRAFYKKLEDTAVIDANISGLKNQIAPCIWDVDSISGIVTDRNKIHIESRVATEADNEVFHGILRTGFSMPNATDLYSKNYQFFFSKCEQYAKDNPIHWQPFCVAILKRCIILPIDCEKLDTALTIFSTLNDRGLPLSDSDIFKAQIYRTKITNADKSAFTREWKALTETVEEAGISLDDLFRYYSHVIRGRNGDKSKEIGLRKFYAGADGKYQKLKDTDLIKELSLLADFWLAISEEESEIDDRLFFSIKSKQYLHCLDHYPNEYWKYVISVYFFKNYLNPNFHDDFSELLKVLISFLFSQFVLKPTVNAIKDPCYQFCIDITLGRQIAISESLPIDFDSSLSQAVRLKIARGMILLHAYLNPNQDALLPAKFEIEHIFPRVWQTANYNGWNQEDAEEYLERFGNKVAFEKKLNIQAGNGYFGRKKEHYSRSAISNVLELASYPENDWIKSDIEKREKRFIEDIVSFFSESLSFRPL